MQFNFTSIFACDKYQFTLSPYKKDVKRTGGHALKKQVLTAYGPVILEVRSLEESRVYAVCERCLFPTGTKTRNGEILKKPFIIPQGAVLVPYWDNFKGKKPKQFHRVFPAGIYEAMRSISHALWMYGLKKHYGEAQFLRDISDRLAKDLAVLMEGSAAQSHKLAEVRSDLADIAKELGRPISKLKSEAAEKISLAATLRVRHPSGKQSRNIPATYHRVFAAKRRIDKRRDQVCKIGPRINFFGEVLAQAIGRIFDDLESLRRILLGERSQIERSLSPEVKRIFCRRTDFVLERILPRFDVLPFLKTADVIRRDLALAKRAKSKKFALAAINRILTSIRLKKAQRAFENLVILPLAIKEGMDITVKTDFKHTKQRLENFIYRFEQEIDDTGFIQPVKMRVLNELRATLKEEFGAGAKIDALRLKERLKRVSHIL